MISHWGYIYTYIYHVVPLALISLTLSRHFSLSFIASGKSSGLHPVSSHSCCMCVGAGRPGFARPYVGVHRSISIMSSSLILQLCLACLVRLNWIVFVMGDRWPYSSCFVGCYFQDLLAAFLCNCCLDFHHSPQPFYWLSIQKRKCLFSDLNNLGNQF